MAVGRPPITSTGIVQHKTLLNGCVSGLYLGTLALATPHVSLLSWKIVLLPTQRLCKLIRRPFIGCGKLKYHGNDNQQRERYGVIVGDFYFRDNNVGRGHTDQQSKNLDFEIWTIQVCLIGLT